MIKTICVCGSGTMGRGIAQVAATAGYDTVLYDVEHAVLAKGKAEIEKSLAALRDRNKLSREQQEAALGRLSFVRDLEACTADLVIEAIIEEPVAKLDLFVQLAAVNGPDTILASNTSSLSLNALAEKIPRPDRFAGMHFFNPAPLMKLVEVVRTDRSSAGSIDQLLGVVRQMGKTPVVCKDSPGFIVNHVARPYYLEALRMVEAGWCDIETVDVLMEAGGFRMGPFRLMDLIGNDINYAVSESVYEALGSPDRLKPSAMQRQKVQEGSLGRKTGKGYYRYE